MVGPRPSSQSGPESLQIAVLAGGIGSEREVSLKSGANIASALRTAGFTVIESDITPDNLTILEDPKINVFFLALHGEFGEDGQLQQILEQRNLTFTGSGSQASRLAFDKIAAKAAFRQCGADVAEDIYLDHVKEISVLVSRLKNLGDKFVIKPPCQGSSVGVEIITGPTEAAIAIHRCIEQFGDCMVERFIAGREITVGILDGKALPIIEIVSKTAFYDYHAKYVDDATEYRFDTITDTGLVQKIQQTAERCFMALDCRHLGRVDLILSEDGTAYVLEINTLPGFTNHSLLPMAARKIGLNGPALCTKIVKAALRDRP
ncbi:MAG: D-alanine--D-alanine ligase [Sedimentisphaerales bacterium]|nr:D-alanine--D-alanine ligase [Sedimentisphaerales bacterium]